MTLLLGNCSYCDLLYCPKLFDKKKYDVLMPYNTDILLQLQYIGIIRRILVYPTSWD